VGLRMGPKMAVKHGPRRNRLTARQVQSLTKPGRYADGGGLYLRIGSGAARRWVFRFTYAGRVQEMGLGSAHDVTLATARQLAAAARQAKANGENPLSLRRAEKSVPHFGDFALKTIASLSPQWKNPKHAAQWRSTLETHAAALWDRPVNKITTSDVLSVLAPIWTAKPETASRVRGRIEKILDAATAAGLRAGENPARWKGNLSHLLASRKRAAPNHFAAMPYTQVPDFMAALGKRKGVAALALRFLILTAARSGEVRGATWAEIDFEARVWTVPASRMKGGRVHRVPLTEAAVALLEQVKPMTGGEPSSLVFPGQTGKALSDMTLAAVLKRMDVPSDTATVHGFRSSFRDWVSEATDFDGALAEAALAHVQGDSVERAYRRGDALERRRRLMQAWDDHLACKHGHEHP